MARTGVITAAVLCIALAANIGLAQGFYVTANAAYGLPAATQSLGYNSSVSTNGTINQDGVYESYGRGVKFGASAGYMFTENIGAELGVSYWLGRRAEIGTSWPGGTDNTSLQGAGFIIVPSVVVSASKSAITPYARLGLVLGILGVKEDRLIRTDATTDLSWEMTGNLAIGYAGALGINVPAGGKVSFFAEVAVHSLSYSPGQIEQTRSVFNGVDQLTTDQDLVTHYQEHLTLTPGGPDQHSAMATRLPFSSIGFAVGARIDL
jgi:hypothetical protein